EGLTSQRLQGVGTVPLPCIKELKVPEVDQGYQLPSSVIPLLEASLALGPSQAPGFKGSSDPSTMLCRVF
ncbi:hypothetical protein HispidOSU_014840, partial [Sigmodon hispidus]